MKKDILTQLCSTSILLPTGEITDEDNGDEESGVNIHNLTGSELRCDAEVLIRKHDGPLMDANDIVTDDGFASRAAGGSISALMRATTDRQQRSVINNVYSLDITRQLIRQEQPSTVPVHPCTHTTNPHTAHLLESVHGTHATTPSLSDLCFTGRQLSD